MGTKYFWIGPRMKAERRSASAAIAREILNLLAADARRQARFFGYANDCRDMSPAFAARDARETP